MKLFGTAGIRLKYGEELDPALAYRVGLAISTLRLSGSSHVVYDTRTTSQLLAHGISTGLMAGGMNVSIVGLAPTPVAGYSARKYKSVGVSVTASHNPPEYNGFKFYDPDGFEFTRDLEKLIEERVDSALELASWSEVGKLYANREDVVEEYLLDLLNYVGSYERSWKPRIVLDLANGAAYKLSPEIVRELGGVPITVNANPNGHFPARKPEPRKDELENYLKLYSQASPAAIFAHDGDADRLAALDPIEGFIRQDRLIALYACLALRDRRGRVIISVDTGRAVDEVVERMGGSVERHVLGKTHERVKELGASNVVLAAEPWKLIDPKWGPWADGLLQVAILTREIISRGKPLAKILEELEIPDYPWDRRSYSFKPASLRDEIYGELVEDLKGMLGEPARVVDIDGYRYEYEDGSWILVRKSGTEPKIRVYSEAPSANRLLEMVEAVERRVNELASKRGGSIFEKTIG